MSGTIPTPHLQHCFIHPTSFTTTWAQHDFSPGSVFVGDAYPTQRNTLLAVMPPAQGQAQSQAQSRSHMVFDNNVQSAPNIDDTYALPSANIHQDNSFALVPSDQSMCFTVTGCDQQPAPVVSDNQQTIAPFSLPSLPDLRNADMLLTSPQISKQRLHAEMNHINRPGTESPGLIDPPARVSFPQMAPVAGFCDGSPHEFPQLHVSVLPPPQFVEMQPQMGVRVFPGQQSYHSRQPCVFAAPRSHYKSPTSSVSSSAISLSRSASTTSELLPARPKVKLTSGDKQNIVKLHRANPFLRQEDTARQYGVGRSTISKIILSARRCAQAQEAQAPSASQQMRQVGGRFPAIEAKMDEWMDLQFTNGLDIRDNDAREKAKAFARELGFPLERFKASAKWFDKFKNRREAAGKPMTAPLHFHIGYYPYTTVPCPNESPMTVSVMLSRSQSVVIPSSSDFSHKFHRIPDLLLVDRMTMVKTDTDVVHAHVDTPTPARQRSQSSLQAIDQEQVMPPSYKAIRLSPLTRSPLTRQGQNSYHDTSPSPRRPAPHSHVSSSHGGIHRFRPGSLGASVVGITPTGGDAAYSPRRRLRSASTPGSSHLSYSIDKTR